VAAPDFKGVAFEIMLSVLVKTEWEVPFREAGRGGRGDVECRRVCGRRSPDSKASQGSVNACFACNIGHYCLVFTARKASAKRKKAKEAAAAAAGPEEEEEDEEEEEEGEEGETEEAFAIPLDFLKNDIPPITQRCSALLPFFALMLLDPVFASGEGLVDANMATPKKKQKGGGPSPVGATVALSESSLLEHRQSVLAKALGTTPPTRRGQKNSPQTDEVLTEHSATIAKAVSDIRDISVHNSEMATISMQMEDKKFLLTIESEPARIAALRNELRELVKLRDALIAKKHATAPLNAAAM
jgi:hypothetical protein